MNTRLLLITLLPLLILGGCTKEITETNTTTVNKPYVAPTLPFWGLWLEINSDPSDTSKTYYELDATTKYCAKMEQEENGLRDIEYSTVLGTDKLIRFDWNSYAPYEISGDTMIVYDNNTPGEVDYILKRVPAGTVKSADWMPSLSIVRRTLLTSNNYSFNTSSSFGIDGDFLYVNHYYDGTRYFYKLNTLNGMYVDSVSAPVNTYYAMHYKAGSNKLYHTRYSGTYNMLQRTGLNGANSNLSSNSLNSIRAISVNGTSGTVYASTSNGSIFSGSEGGNFSSLYSFSGQYPRCIVYYKSDQFLGVYNGTLVLFEISPKFRVIKQYRLVDDIATRNVYESISTNGSDIWIMSYSNSANKYMYLKVTLP